MQLFIMRRAAEMSDHLVQTMKEYIANDCKLVGRDTDSYRLGPKRELIFL
jgi:hypothetical protein